MLQFRLRRVPYGKQDTPLNRREYYIIGSSSTTVGTIEEIKGVFKQQHDDFDLIVHDYDEVRTISIRNKKVIE